MDVSERVEVRTSTIVAELARNLPRTRAASTKIFTFENSLHRRKDHAGLAIGLLGIAATHNFSLHAN
jgi:hypothetical protein